MDKATKAELEKAIRLRAKAKSMEDEAKRLKEESNLVLLPLMEAFQLSEYEVSGIGKATVKVSKGSSINKTKLRENLLIKGLPAEDVQWVLTESSSAWQKSYVEFRRSK